MSEKRIRSKERDAIIQSLKSGVTPKIGIQHIQVGESMSYQHSSKTLTVLQTVARHFA